MAGPSQTSIAAGSLRASVDACVQYELRRPSATPASREIPASEAEGPSRCRNQVRAMVGATIQVRAKKGSHAHANGMVVRKGSESKSARVSPRSNDGARLGTASREARILGVLRAAMGPDHRP